MARESMQMDFVRRSSWRPASHCSSEWTVSLGRIKISLKLQPAVRLRRTLPSISTSKSVYSKFALRATSWNVVVKQPASEQSSNCSGVQRPCRPPNSAASEKWIVLGEDSHLASPVRPDVHQAETRYVYSAGMFILPASRSRRLYDD